MHRQVLLNLLIDYNKKYPQECDESARLMDFVSEHDQCFSRELLTGHVTGSAWVLDVKRERVLLSHHRKLNIWVQPGGHADGDSDILRVARREAEEETGIENLALVSEALFDIDIHPIPARKEEPAHFHYDCRFAFQAVDSNEYRVSDESHDLKWIPLEEVGNYNSEESIRRMVAKTAELRSA